MSELTLPTYAELSAARVQSLKQLLRAALIEYDPSLDLRRGTVHDYVLHPRAVLTAVEDKAYDDATEALSLAALLAGTVTDDEAVDRLLGNYRLVRSPGSAATGKVTIVLNAANRVVVPSGTVFTIANQTFATSLSFAARGSSSEVLSNQDRLLRSIGSGQYAFEVDVAAQVQGTGGNVRRGAVTSAVSQTPNGYLRSSAFADFTGGVDQESNAELAARLTSGMAAKVWSNRTTIDAALRTFSGYRASSTIGSGDPEMTRDRHSLWPVTTGNRADVYVRSADNYSIVSLAKTATLLSKVGTLGTWQFSIGRDDAPGFYDVVSIQFPDNDPSQPGFAPSLDVRGNDLTLLDRPIDIASVAESAFTRYQTATITFADNVTNAAALTVGVSTKAYQVNLRCLPQIKDMQSYWESAANRPFGGDVLVKAAVPCFVAIDLTLNVLRGTRVDTAAFVNELVRRVNQTSFTGRLEASVVSQAAAATVSNLQAIPSLGLTGRILFPDLSTVVLNSPTALVIPSTPASYVTPKTVAFFLSPESVAVTVAFVDAA